MIAFKNAIIAAGSQAVRLPLMPEDQAKAQGIKVRRGLFPWTASGHGKVLGGGMIGTHAGDMIGEIAHSSCTDLPPVRK